MSAWLVWAFAVPAGLVGLVVYLVAARMVAGHVAYKQARKWGAGTPRAADRDVGYVAGALWPFWLVAITANLAANLVAGVAKLLFAHVPPVGAERRALREHELARRRDLVARFEEESDAQNERPPAPKRQGPKNS